MEQEICINVDDILEFQKTGTVNGNWFHVGDGLEIAQLSYSVGRNLILHMDVHFYTGSLEIDEAREQLNKLIEVGVVNKMMREIANRSTKEVK